MRKEHESETEKDKKKREEKTKIFQHFNQNERKLLKQVVNRFIDCRNRFDCKIANEISQI